MPRLPWVRQCRDASGRGSRVESLPLSASRPRFSALSTCQPTESHHRKHREPTSSLLSLETGPLPPRPVRLARTDRFSPVVQAGGDYCRFQRNKRRSQPVLSPVSVFLGSHCLSPLGHGFAADSDRHLNELNAVLLYEEELVVLLLSWRRACIACSELSPNRIQ